MFCSFITRISCSLVVAVGWVSASNDSTHRLAPTGSSEGSNRVCWLRPSVRCLPTFNLVNSFYCQTLSLSHWCVYGHHESSGSTPTWLKFPFVVTRFWSDWLWSSSSLYWIRSQVVSSPCFPTWWRKKITADSTLPARTVSGLTEQLQKHWIKHKYTWTQNQNISAIQLKR